MIRVALSRGDSLLASLIRWRMEGDYAHAALVFDFGAHKFVVAAVRAGVELTEFAPSPETQLFDFAHTPAQAKQIADFARAQLGKPYDLRAALDLGVCCREDRAQSGRWFCSELVVAALAQAGVHLFARSEPWEIDPVTLARSPLLFPTA